MCDVVLASDAEALEKRVEKLEKALREIVDKEYALCYYVEQCNCVKCIAQRALEERPVEAEGTKDE
jgi:hypothetical protein